MLLVEYDQVIEVTEDESELAEELTNHKPIRYYVMNNGTIGEDKAVFERPNYMMQQHIKHLFIWAKLENVGIPNNIIHTSLFEVVV